LGSNNRFVMMTCTCTNNDSPVAGRLRCTLEFFSICSDAKLKNIMIITKMTIIRIAMTRIIIQI